MPTAKIKERENTPLYPFCVVKINRTSSSRTKDR